MKKLFVLGITMVLFLTGCSVNFSNVTMDQKYRVKTYESFKAVKKDLDKDYLAVERIESMDLKDVDSILVATIFEDIEIIYEDRDDVEIQYFAFVSTEALSKEPEYNISTKNDFVFEVKWKKLMGNHYGMMRIFVPDGFKEDITLESISGDIEGYEILSKDLEVNTVSGDINLSKIEAKDIKLVTVSGDINSKGMAGSDLDVSSVSGGVYLSNMAVDGIEIGSVSGEIILNIKTLKDNILIDSVSGDVVLTFDDELSAELDLASISGDIDCDYSMMDVKIKKNRALKATIGRGKYQIDVDTISGDITIK